MTVRHHFCKIRKGNRGREVGKREVVATGSFLGRSNLGKNEFQT